MILEFATTLRSRLLSEQFIPFLFWMMGVLLGCTAGLALSFLWRSDHVAFTIGDVSQRVPTVVIESAPAGVFRGSIIGSGRLLLGNNTVTVDGSRHFTGVMAGSLPREVTVMVPEGMQFVASKSGKKYYPVTSAMGDRILPQNRVYFHDVHAAEVAGYHG